MHQKDLTTSTRPELGDRSSDVREIPSENIYPKRKGHLPVHGVQRVGLVVVPPLVMAHVNRDRRVEGGEDVVGGCENRKAKKKTELDEGGRERRLQKKKAWLSKKRDFKGKRATIKPDEFHSKLSTFV